MLDAESRFRWKHVLLIAAVVVLACIVILAYIVGSGIADRWAGRIVVQQIEKITGTKVELGRFHLGWLPLQARFDGLILHGREPAGTPPVFRAEKLQVDIRVESFWGRVISLRNLELSNFAVHIRVNPDGSTNFPGPAVPGKPGPSAIQRLFELKIARLRLDNGELLWNDTRMPLVAEGANFNFAMDYGMDAARPVYIGRMGWQQFKLAAGRYLPFVSDVSAKFTLRPDSLSVTQLQWKFPHSEIDAQADVSGFSAPQWTFRYRGQSDLKDFEVILRKPTMPAGRVEFTGEGRYSAQQQLNVSGRYTANDVAMKYQWFHAAGISSRGSYRADKRSLDVPDFEAQAFGGTVGGIVHIDFSSNRFRAESHGRGMDLNQVLDAVNNPSLPIDPLHWGGQINVDAVTTWVDEFKHLDSQGVSTWTAAAHPEPSQIPATAMLQYHYEMDRKQVEIAQSYISTPSSRVTMVGSLGADHSSLDTTLDTDDLSRWDDFINRLRGEDAQAQRIGGHFHWQGRVTGPLVGPAFSGHVKGTDASYAMLYWDELELELVYSPDQLHITRGRLRRGRSSADLELTLALDDWSFTPESEWAFDASLVGADPDDLQKMAGTSYPVHGVLNGTFHGNGTRGNPDFSGLVDISNATAWTWKVDRARGQVTLGRGELRVSNAEIRLPPHVRGATQGLITGNILYHTANRDITFDLAGAGIPLEAFDRFQSSRVPVAGRLNLQVRGQGPLLSPDVHGTLRLVDLKVGAEEVGSFDGKLDTMGHHLTATIDSALETGKLSAKLDMDLAGDYPLTANVTVEQIDFDPLIIAALHLKGLTGHSHIDGQFAITGFGARPESIAVDANLSRVNLDLDYLKIENNGPVRLAYRRDEIRIEQANLRGQDTDFRITGSARLAGDHALDLRVDGAVSLQLVAGFVPRLESKGRAQVNAAITGLISAPRVIGKIHMEGATLRYGEFPSGLSNLTGDFNFDTNRIVFENVLAESGGGHLNIGGAVVYGNGTANYTVNVRADQVRIRYPVGMSWLMGGTLRLSGNNQAGLLSGRIVVDRLLMAQGFDLAAFMVSSKEPVNGPSTTSPYLRNLQFDIAADSGPDSRMEWAGANFQTDANLRVRGTWEHPIFLGHIHLLSGEMNFRGNRYTIARGDINFANPFRLDPTLNVEATTTIRQYGVTLDFSGPASKLVLSYRSDPPLPASDIIALLALGQTSQESAQRTATGQGSNVGASTLLSEAISSQLGGRIERLFGVSNFRVGPSMSGPTSGQNSIASVTVEQQITRGLVITYSTNVTSTQYEVIQVEYTVNREYSVVALRDENGTFGIDVIRKTRFK